jgi:hypothetical protein
MLQVNQLRGFGRRRAVVVAGYDPSVNDYWLDPSDLSSMKQDRTGASATVDAAIDAVVGSWLNKGTLGGWLTCNSDAARPILRSGSGLFWLDFDATDDYFHTLPASIDISTNMTICRGIQRASAGIKSIGFGAASGNGPYDAWWDSDNIVYTALGATYVASSSSTSTGNFVLTSRRDGTTEDTRRNGTQISTRTSVAVAGSIIKLCQVVLDHHAGRLYSLVYDNTAIADLTALEAYVAAKSGL